MERFWTKTAKAPSGCLEWQGAKHRDGYGNFRWAGRCVLAHRMAWQLVNGPVPEGMCVLHKCDNPACVQPTHLFLGDHYDNMRDMVVKGRHRSPTDPRMHAKGRHRLSEAQVVDIKHRLQNGETQDAIALRHGVSQSTITNVKRGKVYAYVTI